jgi:pimeloyl-ACP methyl ester carboxylesterase
VPVILFPLSFHVNRVNPAWMSGQQQNYSDRKSIPGNDFVHRFNAVISERLGTHPERFFWGAIQSYWDLVALAREIRSGRHPHFEPDARLDLLGFSAGGYVALALLLEDPEGLFRDSRGVLFATCAAMRDASLSSHLIVDQAAEIALMNLFVKRQQQLSNPRLTHWLTEHPEGKWFRSFCGLRPERTRLEERLQKISGRILGIANTTDHVMPPGAMYNALQGIRRTTGVRMAELELGIHENPFVSSCYDPSDRTIITGFLDEKRFGKGFEEFINLVASHLTP